MGEGGGGCGGGVVWEREREGLNEVYPSQSESKMFRVTMLATPLIANCSSSWIYVDHARLD